MLARKRAPLREERVLSPSPPDHHARVDRLFQQDQIERQIREGLQTGTDSTAVSAVSVKNSHQVSRPQGTPCSQGALRLDPQPEGFDVSRLIVAQGSISLHFVHFILSFSTFKKSYVVSRCVGFLLDSSTVLPL